MAEETVPLDDNADNEFAVVLHNDGTDDLVPKYLAQYLSGETRVDVTAGNPLPVTDAGGQTDALTDTELRASEVPVTDQLGGTFGYQSTTLTSGSLVVSGRVASLRIYADGGDGSCNVNGGDTITIREDTGFDHSPRTNLTSPTINWVSGTLDVFVETST